MGCIILKLLVFRAKWAEEKYIANVGESFVSLCETIHYPLSKHSRALLNNQ